MKFASDYRLDARNSLQNKWWVAVLAGFLAAILGAIAAPDLNLSFDFDSVLKNFDPEEFLEQYRTGEIVMSASPAFSMFLGVGSTLAVITSVVYGLAKIGLGAIIGVGYASFNLHLGDPKPTVNRMFQFFPYWKTLIASRLWRWLFVFLWSLLLVIPGIMASYSYEMTDYILAEHPHMAARDAIALSKEMMHGNRFRLFCLQFSFIGWAILSSLIMGIGFIWLIPYTHAAKAAFYRDLVANYK